MAGAQSKVLERSVPVVTDRQLSVKSQADATFDKRHFTDAKTLPVGSMVMLRDALRSDKNSHRLWDRTGSSATV